MCVVNRSAYFVNLESAVMPLPGKATVYVGWTLELRGESRFVLRLTALRILYHNRYVKLYEIQFKYCLFAY